MPSFGTKSTANLKTIAWDLQRVFQEVVKHYDCTILEGHRGEAKQNAYFNAVPQKSKVEWPDGKHNSYPSQAVDASPWPIPDNWGSLTDGTIRERDMAWKERVKFYQLAALVLFVGKQMGVEIRWGGDWSRDGDYRDNTWDDLIHYEIA